MKTGIAIALAWSETFCKRPGAWYDGLLNFVGISKNHYYQVGHAALVLIENNTEKVSYFDFGRYHAPFGYGRVRNEHTDEDVKIQTKAMFEDDVLVNQAEILQEILHKEACHGTGPLSVATVSIDIEKAYKKAKEMQIVGVWKYGPFVWNGTNCSRFVRTVILAGKPNFRFFLTFPLSISPSPIGIVRSLDNPQFLQKPNFVSAENGPPSTVQLDTTLKMPIRATEIPKESQWLAGEGAGSWFYLSHLASGTYEITRYDVNGKIECKGIYKGHEIDVSQSFTFVHLSHCQFVTLEQNGKLIRLERVK